MSDGHYCLVRDLGPVKGGKGMKHHEVLIDFSLRGITKLVRSGFRNFGGHSTAEKEYRDITSEELLGQSAFKGLSRDKS
jgi:hypothetical protein